MGTISLIAQEKKQVLIVQEGTGHEAEVSSEDYSEGSASILQIYQAGEKNHVLIDEKTYNTRTIISQSGTENDLNFTGGYNTNVFTELEQTGANNILLLQSSNDDSEISVFQGVSKGVAGFNNYAEILTAGFNQYVNLTQIGQEHYARASQGVGSSAYIILQTGKGNLSLLEQHHMHMNFRLRQDGAINFSAAAQQGEGTFMDIFQTGENNSAVANQSGTLIWSFTEQTGEYNALVINQAAVEGHIFTKQKGLSNYLGIDQEGILPDISIRQEGTSNSAGIIQSGSYNHENSFSGWQNGSNNSINSHQRGNAGITTVNQNGVNLRATLIQTQESHLP